MKKQQDTQQNTNPNSLPNKIVFAIHSVIDP